LKDPALHGVPLIAAVLKAEHMKFGPQSILLALLSATMVAVFKQPNAL
jgi:hypothetical protein